MILEKFQTFYNMLFVAEYLLNIFAVALICYIIAILSLVVFTLFRTKNLETLKALHIISIVEVYCFTGLIIGSVIVAKIYGLSLAKIFLFLMIVIFNGITATRLIGKTAYFYNLRFKKSPKHQEQEEVKG